jgi:hypothetical protein
MGPPIIETLLELLLLTRLKGSEFLVYCIGAKQEDLEALHVKGIPVIEMEAESHG